jgi:tRNA(fMet)-specific endonuclease VapC
LNKYLLDTNIYIFYLKGKFNLDRKIAEISLKNCYISEITVAELKFGVENSQRVDKNKATLNTFLSQIQVLSISKALDTYAIEKSRLRKSAILIDDFDLLIGATATTYQMVMVTNNTNHFSRISNIQLEDWTK